MYSYILLYTFFFFYYTNIIHTCIYVRIGERARASFRPFCVGEFVHYHRVIACALVFWLQRETPALGTLQYNYRPPPPPRPVRHTLFRYFFFFTRVYNTPPTTTTTTPSVLSVVSALSSTTLYRRFYFIIIIIIRYFFIFFYLPYTLFAFQSNIRNHPTHTRVLFRYAKPTVKAII